MKYFIVVVMIFALVGCALTQELDEEVKAMLMQFKTECAASTNVDMEMLMKCKEDGVLPETEEMKAFFLCFFQKMGYITAGGDFDKDHIHSTMSMKLGDDVANKMVDTCVIASLGNGKDNAFHLAKCFKENFKM